MVCLKACAPSRRRRFPLRDWSGGIGRTRQFRVGRSMLRPTAVLSQSRYFDENILVVSGGPLTMGSWTVTSNSSRKTMSLGRKLASWVRGGDIVGLVGELGTGKTCFVRGFCAGIEVGKEAWVRSPTFTLINEYQGRLPVYHIDLYRVGKQDELDALNLREYLYADGVSLIEWFE